MFVLALALGMLGFLGGIYFEKRRTEKKVERLAKLTPKQKLKVIKDTYGPKPKKK